MKSSHRNQPNRVIDVEPLDILVIIDTLGQKDAVTSDLAIKRKNSNSGGPLKSRYSIRNIHSHSSEGRWCYAPGDLRVSVVSGCLLRMSMLCIVTAALRIPFFNYEAMMMYREILPILQSSVFAYLFGYPYHRTKGLHWCFNQIFFDAIME